MLVAPPRVAVKKAGCGGVKREAPGKKALFDGPVVALQGRPKEADRPGWRRRGRVGLRERRAQNKTGVMI